MNIMKTAAFAAFVGGAMVATMVASDANAAGFEKSIMWGAESAGKAGIAAPYISGADSIYFNPAGLATGKDGHSIGVNVSPTFATVKGPINNNNTEETSNSTSFPFGLTYGFASGDWGFGIGAFASGGNSVKYDAVDFGLPSGYKPEVKTAIQILEISAGAAYRLDEAWKLGLAWRLVMANAEFAFAQRASNALGAGHDAVLNAKLTELKDTQALAFRAGAQYKVNESTDLALTFRSEVNIDAKGKAGGQVSSVLSPAGPANPPMTSADATAHTTFPMQIALAGLHKLEDWDLLAQYDFSQYSRIGDVNIDSNTFAATGGKTRLKTDWKDQHAIRLAAEYKSPWPVRFGYVYASQVTNSDLARASFSGPGPGHTVTLGTGKAFGGEGEGASNFRVDGALEYVIASGDVTTGAAAGTTGTGTDIRNGKHSSAATTVHLGMTYMF